MDDLASHVLAHLHANAALTADQLAKVTGASPSEVTAAADALVADGHLEQQGDRLVPTASSHPTPGLFVSNEREDAEADEVDYGSG